MLAEHNYFKNLNSNPNGANSNSGTATQQGGSATSSMIVRVCRLRAIQLCGRSGTSEPASTHEKASSCTMLGMYSKQPLPDLAMQSIFQPSRNCDHFWKTLVTNFCNTPSPWLCHPPPDPLAHLSEETKHLTHPDLMVGGW